MVAKDYRWNKFYGAFHPFGSNAYLVVAGYYESNEFYDAFGGYDADVCSVMTERYESNKFYVAFDAFDSSFHLVVAGHCDDSSIEEVFALMKLRFIIFLHITNRAVYIESARLYMSDKRRREHKSREKRKESMHSINDSDERAHTLRRYLNDRSANERNVDIQCYVSNNDRQAMYHHYQRHLHYNCYRH